MGGVSGGLEGGRGGGSGRGGIDGGVGGGEGGIGGAEGTGGEGGLYGVTSGREHIVHLSAMLQSGTSVLWFTARAAASHAMHWSPNFHRMWTGGGASQSDPQRGPSKPLVDPRRKHVE